MAPINALDRKLTERVITFLERIGVEKLAVLGLIGIIVLFITMVARAEGQHQEHVRAEKVVSQQISAMLAMVEKLAEKDAADAHYRTLMLNIWLEMCISANETADRSRRTCQDIASGRLAYIR